MTRQEELKGTFGRYEIQKKLGQGGMGTVYLAKDTVLLRLVALKVPDFEKDDAAAIERFLREARVAANTPHANICTVHDLGEAGGIHYFTMPFIEGGSLASQISPSRPWPAEQAAALVRKLALAMAEMHRHGVIHRDLKPGNIMMQPNGEPVLVDFGTARDFTATSKTLNTGGHIVGTPVYMSPEQFQGNSARVKESSDIYSLGVILYELAAGRCPFEGDLRHIMAVKFQDYLDPPSSVRAGIDEEFDALCQKAMAVAAENRFASMTDFAEALERYCDGKQKDRDPGKETAHDLPTRLTQEGEAPQRKPRSRRTLAAVLAAVVLVTAVTGVGFHLSQGDGANPPKAQNGEKSHPLPPPTPPGILYGGIEIGSQGVKAIVIKVPLDKTGDAIVADRPLLGSDSESMKSEMGKTAKTNLLLLTEDGRFHGQAITHTARTVEEFFRKMKALNVPSRNIYVIVSSGLPGPSNKNELKEAVERAARDEVGQGEAIQYLDQHDEVMRTIEGLLPPAVKNDALLVDVGRDKTRFGYFEEDGSTGDYKTPPCLLGTVSYTQLVMQQSGNVKGAFLDKAVELRDDKFTDEIREAKEQFPGLVNRKRIFLNGDIVWALVTLTKPETAGDEFVKLTAADIENFHQFLKKEPADAPAPALAREAQRVRDTLNPENLAAGAEILRAMSKACGLDQKDKQIIFARSGCLAWIACHNKDKGNPMRQDQQSP